jgi:hypothetical protein
MTPIGTTAVIVYCFSNFYSMHYTIYHEKGKEDYSVQFRYLTQSFLVLSLYLYLLCTGSTIFLGLLGLTTVAVVGLGIYLDNVPDPNMSSVSPERSREIYARALIDCFISLACWVTIKIYGGV